MTMMATTSAAIVAGLPFVARRKRRSEVVSAEVIVGPCLRNQLPAASYLITSCARLSPRITSTVGSASGIGTVCVTGPADAVARAVRRTGEVLFEAGAIRTL